MREQIMEDNKIVDSLEANLDSPENTQEVTDDSVVIRQEDITAVLNEDGMMRMKVLNKSLQRTVKEKNTEIVRLKGILKLQGKENVNSKVKEDINATNG